MSRTITFHFSGNCPYTNSKQVILVSIPLTSLHRMHLLIAVPSLCPILYLQAPTRTEYDRKENDMGELSSYRIRNYSLADWKYEKNYGRNS